eukprot:CAMPEP_0194579968 /NCGR_PEP_ID=MMETSP0292-20121207/13884_1 /TAXON_ID=39354 /ORGANISM="Heterosigma akashiwo, Strain CCMP2393" /LENGTH=516 /DNA_ID=CAMNT_0039433149 /DNA_START=107 /DNA_END=1657 /DNA_ORIENTATION=+
MSAALFYSSAPTNIISVHATVGVDEKGPIPQRRLHLCARSFNFYVYDLEQLGIEDLPRARVKDMYFAEYLIGQSFKNSPCRTADPEAADLFVVPAQPTAALHGGGSGGGGTPADFARALEYLRSVHIAISTDGGPYFNMSQGEDHVWIISHDIGSCLAPIEISKGIFIQSNGDKVQNTACLHEYLHKSPSKPPSELLERAKLPCYDPEKDVVVPPYTLARAQAERWSVPGGGGGGGGRHQRPTLAHFRGTARGWGAWCYSQGIRQFLVTHAKGIEGFQIKTDFTDQFLYFIETLKSKFCFSPSGWAGWSQRIYQAMVAGCVPVLLNARGTDFAFNKLLDYSGMVIHVDLHPNVTTSPPLLLENGGGMYEEGSGGDDAAEILRETLVALASENGGKTLQQIQLRLENRWRYFLYKEEETREEEHALLLNRHIIPKNSSRAAAEEIQQIMTPSRSMPHLLEEEYCYYKSYYAFDLILLSLEQHSLIKKKKYLIINNAQKKNNNNDDSCEENGGCSTSS